MVIVYMIRHPALGWFVGYQRTWFMQRFKPRQPLWGAAPRFIYGVTFHRTFADAQHFLLKHTEFPPGTGISDFTWE